MSEWLYPGCSEDTVAERSGERSEIVIQLSCRCPQPLVFNPFCCQLFLDSSHFRSDCLLSSAVENQWGIGAQLRKRTLI
ncbi:hypothetical protein QQF64_028322 [Cirrhinus molitorella]|uniref:Uncharacterized protein n=1 Tax=Cirrhinus molitorella TaxID=172907 RepID=A0ABR3N697_9TELE